MADERHPSPTEQVKNLYEQTESRTARAFEELVGRDSFGELLARMTENVVGLTKIANDAFDLVLRNMRLAGRQDVTRLARQLARTEDKLELVLQEVEELRRTTTARNGRGPNRSSRRGAARTRGSGGQES